ncbi:methyltransferase domain-containing protein [Hirsutella rhossiliensis]|uniref:Methyltransferase domain-containing protein n=1 Tax=Hirsutella rhossiliensis TaxID=111463 RepID=A0A9P8MV43_9HYPO|nr:methyltransferase domain-containing protein [Hirsutella rhossiliensis]KAH0961582.1 methyltransferase domain-containing protein [Hirsutella rhossiliensis]
MDVIEMQRWAYVQDLPSDIDPVRQLLRTYSRIPEEHVDSHLRRVREDAWNVAHCPFVGRWKFLRLYDSRDPCYQQVVFRLSVSGSRDVFLDLGCCVGQVLRQLRAAGVQGPRLFGTDVQPRFVDIGYDLFRDRDRLGASFVIGDMVDPDDNRLDQLRGKVTIIYAGSFFHLFNWTQQLFIGKRLVSFLKPRTRNALIYGRHVGTTKPGEWTASMASAYLHDAGSFQRLWDEIGDLTKTKWKVEMEAMGELACPSHRVEKGSQPMSFTVYQIS